MEDSKILIQLKGFIQTGVLKLYKSKWFLGHPFKVVSHYSVQSRNFEIEITTNYTKQLTADLEESAT